MSWDFPGTGAFESQVGTVPVTGPPFTMCCFFTPDAVTTEGHIISIHDFSAVELHNLSIDISNTSQLSAGSFDGGWAVADEGTTLTNGVAHHGCGIWTSSTDRVSVLDGNWAGRGTNTTSKNPTGVDHLSIGGQYFNSASTPQNEFNGRIAEVGMWNVALTQSEVEALAAGVSPLLIRPGNLVFYAPFLGDQNDDLTGNAPLTTDGTAPTVVEQHPAIYKPHNQVIRFPSVSGATTVLTGTMLATVDEDDITTGGKTIIGTITGDTLKAAGTGPIGSTADTQALIDGFDSASSPTNGWNNEVRDKALTSEITRDSDTQFTWTVAAQAGFDISSQEVITGTIPTDVLVTGAGAITATPTFTIDQVAAGVQTTYFYNSLLAGPS